MQRAQDRDGFDRGESQFGRDIGRYRRQPQYPDLKHFARGLNRKQILGGVVLNAKNKRLSGDRLAHSVTMTGELIADGGSYQVGPVRIKPLLNQKIDLAQIDEAQIDGDLFIGRLGGGGEGGGSSRHEDMLLPSTWMVHGCFNSTDPSCGQNPTNLRCLKPDSATASRYFGGIVSLSENGSKLAVGAYREDSNATGLNDNTLLSSGPACLLNGAEQRNPPAPCSIETCPCPAPRPALTRSHRWTAISTP